MGVVFIGSQAIGYECLKKIVEFGIHVDAVFTFIPDQHETWKKSVDVIAKENNIPIFFSENLTVEKIKSLNPELILVVGYRKLFPQEILDIPKFGIIGLHASILPHLRGQAPLNWAIINGDLEAGITMFFMDRGIDSGDIIAQKKTKIQDCDNIIDLKKRIDSLAVELIAENINSSIKGTVKRIKQPIEGTYGCQRIPDDGKIDWSKSSRYIFNLIRASEPSYPAFTFYNSKKLFILEAELIENKIYCGTIGQIAMTLKDGSVIVITGDGVLKIKKVQLENEQPVNAKAYLNSSKIRLV